MREAKSFKEYVKKRNLLESKKLIKDFTKKVMIYI